MTELLIKMQFNLPKKVNEHVEFVNRKIQRLLGALFLKTVTYDPFCMYCNDSDIVDDIHNIWKCINVNV